MEPTTERYEHIRLEVRDHVAVATLDRPDVLNALNEGLRLDIVNLASDVRADDDIRALVITGAGRGFCSGADVSGGLGGDRAPGQNELLDQLEGAGRRAVALDAVDKPLIGAINGVAAGAGMSLALSCDLRVGGPRSRFRAMFAERGLSPDSGLSYSLPRVVGYSRALDLLLTSRDVGADEAYRLGLLDRLVGEDEVLDEAVTIAARIASLPPLAIRSTKRVVQHNVDAVLAESLPYETSGLHAAKRAQEDMQEAFASFRERRPPTYVGR